LVYICLLTGSWLVLSPIGDNINIHQLQILIDRCLLLRMNKRWSKCVKKIYSSQWQETWREVITWCAFWWKELSTDQIDSNCEFNLKVKIRDVLMAWRYCNSGKFKNQFELSLQKKDGRNQMTMPLCLRQLNCWGWKSGSGNGSDWAWSHEIHVRFVILKNIILFF
jgi:hypothetical protein